MGVNDECDRSGRARTRGDWRFSVSDGPGIAVGTDLCYVEFRGL